MTRVRAAVLGIAVALCVAPAPLTLGAAADTPEGMAPYLVLDVLIALAFVGSGAVTWARRPRGSLGPLLVGVGTAYAVGGLVVVPVPPYDLIGALTEVLWLALLAHLLLAFPTGLLTSATARVLVTTAYGVVLVGQAAIVAADPTGCRSLAGVPWPPDPALAGTLGTAQAVAGAGLAVGVLVLLARRWLTASATQRRVITPVAAASVLVTGVLAALMPMTTVDGDTGWWPAVLALVLPTIPLGHVVSVVRARLDRATMADLVVRLRDGIAPGRIDAALAASLHDPSLRLAYPVRDTDRWVDADGRPVALTEPGRAVTHVERAGHRIAALVHDPALLDAPELVDAACAAAGLALENERLAAELRARVREIDATRARVVRAAEGERRRIERDLHDGAQQRLLSASMTLGRGEALVDGDPARARTLLAEAKTTLLSALDDLRAIGQGLHPAMLTERGLDGAVRELAYGAGIPVDVRVSLPAAPPPEIEATAYFVVAEGLANVLKHAAAGRAGVRLEGSARELVVEVHDDGRGGAEAAGSAGRSGLRGLAERVAAVGGRWSLVSPPGAGTVLRAVLPCG